MQKLLHDDGSTTTYRSDTMHNENLQLVAQLTRQNRLLKGVLAATGASLALITLSGATTANQPVKFTEIDVERINIVTPDGKKDIVIANRNRLPLPVVDGKMAASGRGEKPGLIFYNTAGDENGGLIFDGKLDDKGKPQSGMHFSMDRFGGDQQLSLGHYENGGAMETGLKVYDRGLARDYEPLYEAYEKAAPGPEKDALLQKWKDAGGQQTSRMFVGRTRGQSSAVILADAKGRARIMMTVSPDGKASLEFRDDQGKVIQRLPQEAKVAQADTPATK